ncbi:MAG TPA: ABC transporter ATP-binding protein [Rhodopila sp.]|uniref:ABC transporter ATP-binding protein n=1 Tax=Rhodopila sp. TaxID=2480087 RepID=UPI002CAFA3AF|nr:ABC transporter ATP-binding protein [Rhodopila sp.]HVY16653.1 ABC transporter ATP-binding protein [Rhodopila sp.]
MTDSAADPLLIMTGMTKQYPGCLANDHVNLTIERNQIHALLGENGAGKSTLVKTIYGVVKPDSGEMIWDGRKVAVQNPGHAQRLGIGMVFQHFSLFEALTVAENIALGLGSAKERAGLKERIAKVSNEYGLPLDPDRVVHDLSVGERQRIEIVRCLLQNPKLLIMDEPTSVLTPSEVQALFVTLRRLAAEGCSILYISHKLEEVRALCSHATIMRLGRNVGEVVPAEKSVKELAEIMINMDLHAPIRHTASARSETPRLVLDRLTVRSPYHFGTDLKDIALALMGGEILGIAGIAGNGQSELMDALSGEILAGRPENILIDGVPAGHMGPSERRRIRGCFVPEERNGHGAVTTMTLAENAFLSGHAREALVRFGIIDGKKTHAFADDIIKRFDVRTTGPKAEARSLSGGNLQKFLVGREVLQNPSVLVINQPTWGVDAGAAVAIHESIMALAQAGAAVMIISQDLDEIFVLADRIAVIAGGRISDPVPTADATVESIGRLMGGTAVREAADA